jgi:hypothetical protein
MTYYTKPGMLQDGWVNVHGLLDTLFSPQMIMDKERQRYVTIVQETPLFETLIFALSLVTLATRRGPGDKKTSIMFLGGLVGAAFILYNSSPFYFIHLFPVMILPVAPFLIGGFTNRGEVTWRNIPLASIAALVIAIAFLLRQPWTEVVTPPRLFTRSSDSPEIVTRVHRAASPECKIAGDRMLYVPYFLSYPRFHSTTLTEERLGSLYLGGRSYLELWVALQPDVVFGSLDERILPYVEQARYKEIEPEIWLNTQGELSQGCVIRTNR